MYSEAVLIFRFESHGNSQLFDLNVFFMVCKWHPNYNSTVWKWNDCRPINEISAIRWFLTMMERRIFLFLLKYSTLNWPCFGRIRISLHPQHTSRCLSILSPELAIRWFLATRQGLLVPVWLLINFESANGKECKLFFRRRLWIDIILELSKAFINFFLEPIDSHTLKSYFCFKMK